jgi:hypothetical protein
VFDQVRLWSIFTTTLVHDGDVFPALVQDKQG